MSRKALCLVFSALLFALRVSAQAQSTGKVFRIGVLDRGPASGSLQVSPFWQELNKLGWIESKTLP